MTFTPIKTINSLSDRPFCSTNIILRKKNSIQFSIWEWGYLSVQYILRGDKFCTTHPFVPSITRGYQCAVAVVWASILPVLYIEWGPCPLMLKLQERKQLAEFGVSVEHES